MAEVKRPCGLGLVGGGGDGKRPAVPTGIGQVGLSWLGEGVEMGVRKREVARMPLNI